MSIIADRVVPGDAARGARRRRTTWASSSTASTSRRWARASTALYLPPPSRPDKPLSVKTLIVPTQEYSEGRNVILTTGRSVYTVALRHLVEQRAEWSWCRDPDRREKARI